MDLYNLYHWRCDDLAEAEAEALKAAAEHKGWWFKACRTDTRSRKRRWGVAFARPGQRRLMRTDYLELARGAIDAAVVPRGWRAASYWPDEASVRSYKRADGLYSVKQGIDLRWRIKNELTGRYEASSYGTYRTFGEPMRACLAANQLKA